MNTEGFACPNQQCPYCGITDAQVHALVGDGKHGHGERIQTFRGPACRTTFSARRHTPLYRLKTPSQQVAMVLAALAEGLDPSAAERVFGYRQATITARLSRAGEHAQTLHERCFRHLWLPHLQLDELRTRLRCAKQVLASGCLPLFTSDGLNLYFKPARNGFGEGWSIYPPYLIGAPLDQRAGRSRESRDVASSSRF